MREFSAIHFERDTIGSTTKKSCLLSHQDNETNNNTNSNFENGREGYFDVIERLIAMETRVNQELFAKYSHGNGFSNGLDHSDTVLGSFYSLIKLNGKKKFFKHLCKILFYRFVCLNFTFYFKIN